MLTSLVLKANLVKQEPYILSEQSEREKHIYLMNDACLALDTVPPKWYSQINEY